MIKWEILILILKRSDFARDQFFSYLYQRTDCIFYLIWCEFADAEQRGWRIRRHRSYRSESPWWRTEQVSAGWRLLLDCSIRKRWWTVKFPIPYRLPCAALLCPHSPSLSVHFVRYRILWDFIIDDKISVNCSWKSERNKLIDLQLKCSREWFTTTLFTCCS